MSEICPKCGKKVEKDDVFCLSCGEKLNNSARVVEGKRMKSTHKLSFISIKLVIGVVLVIYILCGAYLGWTFAASSRRMNGYGTDIDAYYFVCAAIGAAIGYFLGMAKIMVIELLAIIAENTGRMH